MPTTIRFVEPFTAAKIAISSGGASQITIIEFEDAPQGLAVSLVPDNDMFTTHRGDEGDAIDDDLAFPITSGGLTEINSQGWGDETGTPRIRLSSVTPGAFVRVLLQRKP